LHLFELRFRTLVSRALATDRKFIIMRRAAPIGCIVNIVTSRSTADGRFYIEGLVESRCRVDQIRFEEGGHGLECGEAHAIVDLKEDEEEREADNKLSEGSEQEHKDDKSTKEDEGVMRSNPESKGWEQNASPAVRYREPMEILKRAIEGLEEAMGDYQFKMTRRVHGDPPLNDPEQLCWWVCRVVDSHDDLRMACLTTDSLLARLAVSRQLIVLGCRDARTRWWVQTFAVGGILAATVGYAVVGDFS